ncbi:hypothetical protein [Spiroplasma citri]|uniref:Uncharacterized protein n=1 Tax=Spiroplasma citri TaxID=2133 RepID=A0AAJ4EKD2_SPICI|nr:hypothetical protein [Spiroplasma citri]APE75264.1 hypothetical protein SCITRI_001389 [Spiroplasma citri]QED25161.1 hypothetical protein FRX96_07245 [Spiroplasma citri]QIA67520.1 hypothetical protein GMI18_07745 [Spiroplasma citri]QIA69376.1 hypothetical protein GL298_07705 [Spiroplasma citri]QIA71241.1 hypothetical protein GL981_07750 [Spiroplasma citri]
MKKLLSLIGATTITTSGGAPLMAMMSNNQKKPPTLQKIITTIDIGYINKVDEKTIFNKLKEKKIFLSQELFIENLEIIDIFLEDKNFIYKCVNGYAKIKLKENSNICIKKQNLVIQKTPEDIIYTINFYTNNKKYQNKIKWNHREWVDKYW